MSVLVVLCVRNSDCPLRQSGRLRLPKIELLEVLKNRNAARELFLPRKLPLPIVLCRFIAGFCRFEAFEVLIFPGSVIKIRISFIPLRAECKVLLDKFQIEMHGEKIPVFSHCTSFSIRASA